MQFKDVIGNAGLKKQLLRMADSGRTSHALMFIEKDGCGALPMVMAFMQYLSCGDRRTGVDSCGECPSCKKLSRCLHQDLHFAFPVNASSGGDRKPVSGNFLNEWRELVEQNPYFTETDLYRKIRLEDKVGAISVHEAKDILLQLSLRAYEGHNKYMVVWLPERMSAEAANRLLKIIEEPAPDTYFFFITHAPEKVLGTIRSRTLPVRVLPAETEELGQALAARFGIAPEEAERYARTSGGSFGLACNMIAEGEEGGRYRPLLENLLKAKIAGDLLSMLECSEEYVALGREKQKQFSLFSLDFLRKVLMVKKGIPSISNASPSEEEAVRFYSERLAESFLVKACAAIDEARRSVESNVNAKIVFCNLVNYLFVA